MLTERLRTATRRLWRSVSEGARHILTVRERYTAMMDAREARGITAQPPARRSMVLSMTPGKGQAAGHSPLSGDRLRDIARRQMGIVPLGNPGWGLREVCPPR